MKRSSFREEQIAHVLRQAEAGVPVQELIRKTGITEQTFSIQRVPRWERGFGGMGVAELRSAQGAPGDYSKKRIASSNRLWPIFPWTRQCFRRCEPFEVIAKKL